MRAIARLVALALVLTACGVKTPPLPPFPETPQKSDRARGSRLPIPTPTPADDEE